ncbi:MAG: hypothetical protein VKK42_24635 [Lyngbya sp.]|nr:hypothetical protein [Lyngbya sp.]
MGFKPYRKYLSLVILIVIASIFWATKTPKFEVTSPRNYRLICGPHKYLLKGLLNRASSDDQTLYCRLNGAPGWKLKSYVDFQARGEFEVFKKKSEFVRDKVIVEISGTGDSAKLVFIESSTDKYSGQYVLAEYNNVSDEDLKILRIDARKLNQFFQDPDWMGTHIRYWGWTVKCGGWTLNW